MINESIIFIENNKGNGSACIVENGTTFEKAGVNVSQLTIKITQGIYKTMSDQNHMRSISADSLDDYQMFACGLSLVIHPINPFVPTVHANYRVLIIIHKETKEIEDWWFGGGCDLTPIYLNVSDAIHFHKVLKEACDKHDESYYPKYKDICDKYFYIPYRKEARGIGGIFFENLNDKPFRDIFNFAKECGNSFVESYCPIVARRKDTPYTEEHEEFRKWRRSRYAEFNLVFDRGTKFGLHTPNANIENILMSLPMSCSWKYNYKLKNKEEEKIIDALQNPKDWINHPANVMSKRFSRSRSTILSYPLVLFSKEEEKSEKDSS